MNKADSIKRSIHAIVSDETHVAFKATCVQQKLTMQDFIEECINRLLDGDDDFLKFASEIARKKKEKTIKRVSNTDADSVYRAISGG